MDQNALPISEPLNDEASETPVKAMTQPTLLQKNSLKSRWKEYGYLSVCFLIPAIVVLLIYIARGEHPIDDSCVLVLDLNAQYVWFFEALRNFVRGDADLLYSFSRALGGEFLGIYAYYLASPLSYLLCLFPTERMLEGLLVLFMIKAGLCGVSFGYYIHKTQDKINRAAIIAFSTLYALSAYAIIQQSNTMWIDALFWLPLITLGIESVIKYGKFKLYTVSLAIGVFSNYYIGWMLCIYCLVYFFVYYFAHAEDHRNNPLYEKLHFLRSILRMVFYSLIALGMAALILLAAFYSLNFGKTTFSDPSWEVAVKFDLLEFFYKLLPGSYDTVRPEGLPFVYCGILTLLLLPSYFLSKKYSAREKIFSALLIVIFLASFSINVVDLVWHGFQNPNWLNHRYSFMLSFYLCVLACRVFSDFDRVSLKTTALTATLIGVLCLILQTYTDEKYLTPDDFTCIYLSLAFLLVYIAVLALLRSSANKTLVTFTLLVVIVGEVFLNGLFGINALGEDVGFSKYSYYNDFLKKSRVITAMVQENDDSFYRMEKTFFRKTNDNMALGIRGLSGSTSTLNKETIKILNKMGYSSKSHWSKYLGGTPLNDSLLGLKYIITDKDHSIYEDYYEEAHTYVYTDDAGKETKYVAYRNPYALSIAYGVSNDVLYFPLGYIPSTETETKEDKDSAVSLAVDALKDKLNELLGIEENDLSEYEDAYTSPFERLNAMVSAMLGEEETLQIFVPVEVKRESYGKLGEPKNFSGGETGYKTIPSDIKNPSVFFETEMPTDAELYFYLPTNFPREIEISVSRNANSFKKKGTFNGNETARIISLGEYREGDDIELEMTLIKNQLYWLKDTHCFYYLDMEAFKNAMERLATDQLAIEEYTERSFEGTFTASKEKQLVMTTLAYDNGWNVFVDGERVELIKTFGAFAAFYIEGEAGETHTVEMFYMPKTIVIGFLISAVSILIFIALLIIDRKRGFGCKDRRPALIDAAEDVTTTEDEQSDPVGSTATASTENPISEEAPEESERKEE